MDTNDTSTSQQKNSAKMLLIGVVLIALIGGGAWYFMSQNKTQPAIENTLNQAEDTTMDMTVTPDSATTQPQEAAMTVDTDGTKVFTIEAKNYSFSVKDITVSNGDKVKIVLVNKQGFHDWVNDLFNAKTKVIQAGETAEVEFVANKVGTSEYYCSIGNHRQMGMTGNLIVEK